MVMWSVAMYLASIYFAVMCWEDGEKDGSICDKGDVRRW